MAPPEDTERRPALRPTLVRGGHDVVPAARSQDPADVRKHAEGLGMPSRYEAVRRLAEGGEAVAFLCRDTQSGNAMVVVKMYAENVSPDPDILSRLQTLEHPNILRLIDFGETPEGRWYETSEHAAGGTLALRRKTGESLGVTLIESVLLPQICAALRHCHDAGVVHRDVKPENVFFRDATRDSLVLGDYGLASPAGQTLRLTERAGGTELFAAPEVIVQGGAAVAAAADYYALGITLYLLVGGEAEIDKLTTQRVRQWKLEHRLRIPDGLPERWVDLLKGLLHPQRQHRWGAAEIERWQAGESVAVHEYSGESEEALRYTLGRDRVANSRPELALTLLGDLPLGREHVITGTLAEFFARRDPALAVSLRKIVARPTSEDARVVESAYTLDPAMPLVLVEGKLAQDPRALAHLIDGSREVWNAARDALSGGFIEAWLRGAGFQELEKQWASVKDAYTYPAQLDEALEHLLHVLDERLVRPRAEVTPHNLALGVIPSSDRREVTLRICNRGRGFLSGVIRLVDTIPGLSLSSESVGLHKGESVSCTLLVDATRLERGRRYEASLRLTSNAGEPLRLPITLRVGVPAARLTAWAVGFAVVGAMGGGVYRQFLTETVTGGSRAWLSTVPTTPGPSGAFAALSIMLIGLVLLLRRLVR